MSIQVVKKCLVGKCPGQNMSGQEMSGQKLESQEKGVEKCRSTNVWSRNVHESRPGLGTYPGWTLPIPT